MSTPKKKQERTIYRSSVSGRMVSKRYAEAHPSTTQRERHEVARRRTRGSKKIGGR